MGNEALRVARQLAAGMNPVASATACGAEYEGDHERGVFRITLLGDSITVTFPELEVTGVELPQHIQALIIYYLGGSDGSEPTGEWTSFGDLPDGGFYVQAFKGYSASAIARAFGNDADRLERELAKLGAAPLDGMAERAWRVPALPRVPIAVLWWHGDDEFEPRVDVLFDETAPGHLPTDGLAVLGGWIAKRVTAEAD